MAEATFNIILGYFLENSAANAEEALKFLRMICENIYTNPEDVRFRKLRKENPKIKSFFMDVKGGIEVLNELGFETMPSDPSNLIIFAPIMPPSHCRKTLGLSLDEINAKYLTLTAPSSSSAPSPASPISSPKSKTLSFSDAEFNDMTQLEEMIETAWEQGGVHACLDSSILPHIERYLAIIEKGATILKQNGKHSDEANARECLIKWNQRLLRYTDAINNSVALFHIQFGALFDIPNALKTALSITSDSLIYYHNLPVDITASETDKPEDENQLILLQKLFCLEHARDYAERALRFLAAFPDQLFKRIEVLCALALVNSYPQYELFSKNNIVREKKFKNNHQFEQKMARVSDLISQAQTLLTSSSSVFDSNEKKSLHNILAYLFRIASSVEIHAESSMAAGAAALASLQFALIVAERGESPYWQAMALNRIGLLEMTSVEYLDTCLSRFQAAIVLLTGSEARVSERILLSDIYVNFSIGLFFKHIRSVPHAAPLQHVHMSLDVTAHVQHMIEMLEESLRLRNVQEKRSVSGKEPVTATPSDLDQDFAGASITALTLSTVYLSLQNAEKALEFAEFALDMNKRSGLSFGKTEIYVAMAKAHAIVERADPRIVLDLLEEAMKELDSRPLLHSYLAEYQPSAVSVQAQWAPLFSRLMSKNDTKLSVARGGPLSGSLSVMASRAQCLFVRSPVDLLLLYDVSDWQQYLKMEILTLLSVCHSALRDHKNLFSCVSSSLELFSIREIQVGNESTNVPVPYYELILDCFEQAQRGHLRVNQLWESLSYCESIHNFLMHGYESGPMAKFTELKPQFEELLAHVTRNSTTAIIEYGFDSNGLLIAFMILPFPDGDMPCTILCLSNGVIDECSIPNGSIGFPQPPPALKPSLELFEPIAKGRHGLEKLAQMIADVDADADLSPTMAAAIALSLSDESLSNGNRKAERRKSSPSIVISDEDKPSSSSCSSSIAVPVDPYALLSESLFGMIPSSFWKDEQRITELVLIPPKLRYAKSSSRNTWSSSEPNELNDIPWSTLPLPASAALNKKEGITHPLASRFGSVTVVESLLSLIRGFFK